MYIVLLVQCIQLCTRIYSCVKNFFKLQIKTPGTVTGLKNQHHSDTCMTAQKNETEFPGLEMTWDQKTPFPIDPYHQSNKPFVSPTVYMYPGLFNEEAVSAVQT